jgi:hypothetical protein
MIFITNELCTFVGSAAASGQCKLMSSNHCFQFFRVHSGKIILSGNTRLGLLFELEFSDVHQKLETFRLEGFGGVLVDLQELNLCLFAETKQFIGGLQLSTINLNV